MKDNNNFFDPEDQDLKEQGNVSNQEQNFREDNVFTDEWEKNPGQDAYLDTSGEKWPGEDRCV